MNIQLIDLDSVIPNLALMKISAYHKSIGDHVFLKRYRGLHIPCNDLITNPHQTYLSKVFEFSVLPSIILEDTFIGGIGINDQTLPKQIEKCKPDYDLYPSTESCGRTTKGCFRHCYFCRVPSHEGKLQKTEHPKYFHDDRFDTMRLLDNNWLGIRNWFFETSQWIIDHNIKLIENGLDARLFTTEIVDQLCRIKWKNDMKIAFDSKDDQSKVNNAINLLQNNGFNTRSKLVCYCYLHDNLDRSFSDILERIEILRALNTSPFVMFNCMNEPSRRTNALKRYVNKHRLFWSMTFKEYCLRAYKQPLPFDIEF